MLWLGRRNLLQTKLSLVPNSSVDNKLHVRLESTEENGGQ